MKKWFHWETVQGDILTCRDFWKYWHDHWMKRVEMRGTRGDSPKHRWKQQHGSLWLMLWFHGIRKKLLEFLFESKTCSMNFSFDKTLTCHCRAKPNDADYWLRRGSCDQDDLSRGWRHPAKTRLHPDHRKDSAETNSEAA